jgi:C4-dicarboxylate-specific signal transduction histidine kinase
MLMVALCQVAKSKVLLEVTVPDATGGAEWTLSQDGPAITPEQLSWIHAPFTTTRHARLGLGLAFTYRVMVLLGGAVKAEERSEGGTRVTLIFPPGSSKH